MGKPLEPQSEKSDKGNAKPPVGRKKISPVVRFVILFLIMLLLVGIGFSQLFTRYHDQMLWLMRLTATITGEVVSVFTGQVDYSGVYVSFRGFTVEIIDECTGLFEMLIFIAAVIAFSAPWRKKLIGFAMGIPAIFIFNILRIIILLLAGAYSKSIFDFLHIYFWQGTLIIMISSVWVAWLYLVVYREKRAVAVSS